MNTKGTEITMEILLSLSLSLSILDLVSRLPATLDIRKLEKRGKESRESMSPTTAVVKAGGERERQIGFRGRSREHRETGVFLLSQPTYPAPLAAAD